MIDVLYYMYYLFYLKKLKDTEPHVRTIWGISFLFFCVAIGGLNLIWVVLFSKMVNFWIMMAFFPLIILIMYVIYYRSGKGQYIVDLGTVCFYRFVLQLYLLFCACLYL